MLTLVNFVGITESVVVNLVMTVVEVLGLVVVVVIGVVVVARGDADFGVLTEFPPRATRSSPSSPGWRWPSSP